MELYGFPSSSSIDFIGINVKYSEHIRGKTFIIYHSYDLITEVSIICDTVIYLDIFIMLFILFLSKSC